MQTTILYDPNEILYVGIAIVILLTILCIYALLSVMYSHRRVRGLFRIAKQRLNRNLTPFEAITICLAYKRLSYSDVLGLITETYHEVETND